MTIYEYVKKLRALPDNKKLAIIITVVVIVGLVLGFFWVRSSMYNISKIGQSMQSLDIRDKVLPQDAISSLSDIQQRIDGQVDQVHSGLQAVEWKVYSNDVYGFEITYPGDWQIPTQKEGENKIDFDGKFFITYYKNDSDLPGNNKTNFPLDKWLQENHYSYLDKATIENTMVGDNYPALKIQESYCNEVPLLADAYFTLKGAGSVAQAHGNIYQIEGPIFECGYKNVNQEYEAAQEVLDQIIKTFKINDGKK